jgi:hypothetical protein
VTTPENRIRYIKGDCIEHALGIFRSIIVHGCNNIGAWGAGFTAAIDAVDAGPGIRFRSQGPQSLGSRTSTWIIGDDGRLCRLVNLVTQDGVRSVDNPIPFRYWALGHAFKWLENDMRQGDSIHMPRIGCGLAGASWEQVELFVQDLLVNQGIPVTVYDL